VAFLRGQYWLPALFNNFVGNMGSGIKCTLCKYGFSLQKRRLQGDLIVAFHYLKEAYRKAGEGLFTRPCSDRTKGNGF